ncbi:MAG: CDP-glycerol glycerophosphotransferase family protein [Bacteroidales bacterium]|nr:CDP-glycerol glycerophosphotransferase family protein [Bacteroidales bacterium]
MTHSLKETVHGIIEPARYRCVLIPRARRHHAQRIRRIRGRGKAKVCFLVASLPMWRFQSLFDLLAQDSRFELMLALHPFEVLAPAAKEKAMAELRDYCSARGIPCIDLLPEEHPGQALRERFDPDIIFYPQPYNRIMGKDLDGVFFQDRMIAYIPYATLTAKDSWAYKTLINNVAWRLFFPSESRKQDAAAVLYNGGKNIRVVGESISDLFREPVREHVWKAQDAPRKRVIWAPHYSIMAGGLLHRDSFTWLSRFMWEIAQRYQDRIQFAFKPHPRLLSALAAAPGWSQADAEAYFQQWAEGSNTQLVTGSYVDLFKESDAMIHDSSSFTVEYHFTQKPVLFTSTDLTGVLSLLNDFGQEAVLAHYLGETEQSIVSFIEDTVLGDHDPMKAARQAFYEKYLRPPGSGSVAENIYHEILQGLGFEE